MEIRIDYAVIACLSLEMNGRDRVLVNPNIISIIKILDGPSQLSPSHSLICKRDGFHKTCASGESDFELFSSHQGNQMQMAVFLPL